jgi:hypothetical protein
LGIALGLASAAAQGQITRDVGHVAVIEADARILFDVFGSDGKLCKDQKGVDMDEVTKKFYRTHASDAYDFIILFTTFDFFMLPSNCVEQAAGLYVPVSNDVRGIGRSLFDNTSTYGSAPGVLRGTIHLGDVNRFLNPPLQVDLSTLAQEVGHRWGAYVRFDADPSSPISPSMNLLGRDNSHWSFYLNSASATSDATTPKASGLEGNFWVANGSGFVTQTQTDGFSELDLYLMGLLPPSEVDDFWYIANPSSGIGPGTNPTAGAFTGGTRRNVAIEDVIAVEGARTPAFGDSPRVFRQAFLLLTEQGVDATAAQIARVEDYRRAWEEYFAHETLNRGAVVTELWGLAFADAQATGSQRDGSLEKPYRTLAEGLGGTPAGGTLVLHPGRYAGHGVIAQPIRLRAVLGPVEIGN